MAKEIVPDDNIADELVSMGFAIEIARRALQTAANDMAAAIDMLIRMQNNGLYQETLNNLLSTVGNMADAEMPSTSTDIGEQLAKRLKKETQVMEVGDQTNIGLDH